MIDPSIQYLITDNNPVIRGTGTALFGKNKYCIWCTSNGSTSICNIQNPSASETLTFVVSGAPESMYTNRGKKFNGQHSLPPNQPTVTVTAIGDFLGQQVSIFNMSATNTPCKVATYVPSTVDCSQSDSQG